MTLSLRCMLLAVASLTASVSASVVEVPLNGLSATLQSTPLHHLAKRDHHLGKREYYPAASWVKGWCPVIDSSCKPSMVTLGVSLFDWQAGLRRPYADRPFCADPRLGMLQERPCPSYHCGPWSSGILVLSD